MAALDRGDRATHDRLVVEASKDLRDCDLIALAQYSMAPAADAGRRGHGTAGAHHAGQRGDEAEGDAGGRTGLALQILMVRTRSASLNHEAQRYDSSFETPLCGLRRMRFERYDAVKRILLSS